MTDAVLGCLLGTAVGDAMGLPYEGLSRHTVRNWYGRIDGHRWVFGRGMISDDTEHTWIVAAALVRAAGDVAVFERELAKGFRLLFLAAPPAVGWATLRACLKLLVGFGPTRSGVFSAGNGPAIRSALIGVWFREDLERMRAFVRVSTRITHTDPKAEYGALAVALAAAGKLDRLGEYCPDEAFVSRVQGLEFDPGDGIGGYIYDTVPAAIALAARHAGDFRMAVVEAIRCGGDTDTVAAITGAIVGAGTGEAGIPREWVDGIRDWPRGVTGLRRLAAGDVPRVSVLGSIWRNLVFFGVALVHVVGTIRGR